MIEAKNDEKNVQISNNSVSQKRRLKAKKLQQVPHVGGNALNTNRGNLGAPMAAHVGA
jgi:hypothetical protein